jgi:hypothetical protein
VRGLVQSMGVIGAVVACIYVFVPHGGNSDPVAAVDYRVELLSAQRAAPYPVEAPVGLSARWKPTSVSYTGQDGNAWHLGFLDPEQQYVAVEQSTDDPEKFVTSVTRDASKTSKTQRVEGETWQRWEGPKYDALVRRDKGSTTVVMGTAPYEQLTRMASALTSKPKPKPES